MNSLAGLVYERGFGGDWALGNSFILLEMNEYKMVCEKDDIRWEQMDEGWLSKVKLDIQVVWVTPSSGLIFS